MKTMPGNSPKLPPITRSIPHSRLTGLAARLSFCRDHMTRHEYCCQLMRAKYLLFAVLILALMGCSTTHRRGGGDRVGSETVLITYHVLSGKEAELQALLSQAWEVYRSEQMVFYKPHTLVRTVEDGDKTRFVEVFTWVKHLIMPQII
jgi:hypothetical protein